MTPDEINEILAKAEGWTHEWFDGRCAKCRCYYDGEASPHCPPPDYTTSYPDLARVERKVYGDEFEFESNCFRGWSVKIFAEDPRASIVMASTGSSELHARAECCARVVQEQGDTNGR